MTNRILYALAVVAGLILVFWVGSQCSGNEEKYQREVAVWQERGKFWEAEAKAAKAERDDSLRAMALRVREDSATVADVDALRSRLAREREAKNQALVALRRRAEAAADTGALRQTARDALALAEATRAEADSLDAGLSRARAVIERGNSDRAMLVGIVRKLETQNDSLLVLIKTVPVHKGERLLGFIPLPSRTASLAIGAVAGAAAAVWLTKE